MNFGALTSVLFSRRCLACKAKLLSGALCAPCLGTVDIARGAPRRPPGYPHFLGAAGKYENAALKSLILALKFGGVKAAAEPLSFILAMYALPFKERFDGYLVVPIPLSRERLRVRGFNQSERIATPFAVRFGLPLATNILMRVAHAKPQSETANLAERKENIRGCFALAGSAADLSGRRFILIDDVTTSGATFLEAARVLRGAHAEEIVALAVAQA